MFGAVDGGADELEVDGVVVGDEVEVVAVVGELVFDAVAAAGDDAGRGVRVLASMTRASEVIWLSDWMMMNFRLLVLESPTWKRSSGSS